MTDGLAVVRDCTTCKHHKHLKWLDQHICKYPQYGGHIANADIHNTGCFGWEPMEADV